MYKKEAYSMRNRSSDLILTIQPGDLSVYSHVLEDRLIQQYLYSKYCSWLHYARIWSRIISDKLVDGDRTEREREREKEKQSHCRVVRIMSSRLVESILSIGRQSTCASLALRLWSGIRSRTSSVTLMARKTTRGNAHGLGLVVDQSRSLHTAYVRVQKVQLGNEPRPVYNCYSGLLHSPP